MPEASPAARARRIPVPGSGKVWNLLRPAPSGPGGRRRPAAVGAPTRPPSPSSISPLSRPLLEGARSPQRSEPVPRRGSAPQLPEASGLSCRPMYWGRMWFRARSASLANRGWLLGHVGASLVRCQILNRGLCLCHFRDLQNTRFRSRTDTSFFVLCLLLVCFGSFSHPPFFPTGHLHSFVQSTNFYRPLCKALRVQT